MVDLWGVAGSLKHFKKVLILTYCHLNFRICVPSLLSNLNEFSPLRKGASCAAPRELPGILWNRKVNYNVHKSPPLTRVLGKIRSIHTTLSYLSKIHLNIIRPTTSFFKMVSFMLVFPNILQYEFLSSPVPNLNITKRSGFLHNSKYMYLWLWKQVRRNNSTANFFWTRTSMYKSERFCRLVTVSTPCHKPLCPHIIPLDYFNTGPST